MSFAAGQLVGEYEILALIGAGGMGEVYRARDRRLGREVAIKILPAALASDPERRARFEREARTLASLNHPHIAHVYGLESIGVDDAFRHRALVMELVAGEDLADRVAGGAVPLADALSVARQIADALEAAHEAGIIHRDLKPANISVRPDGMVKVLDFGLAKLTTDGEAIGSVATVTATQAGVVLGTPAYMSPEQARGLVVDKRTDIWAFGCVLFEMLTGRPAFRGATMTDVLAGVLEREPEWSALDPDTPPIILRLLRRCLEKDHKRRLRDIGDARADIEEALSAKMSKAIPAASPSAQPLRIVVAASIAMVALVGVAGWWVGTRMGSTSAIMPATHASAALLTSYGGMETAGALSPDGRMFAFVSDHGDTPDIWLRQVSGGEPVRLTNDALVETELAFAADGEHIYFTRTENAVPAIWETGLLGGQPRKVVGGAHAAAVSRDGRRLAFMVSTDAERSLEELVVSDLDGGNRRVVARSIPAFPSVRPSWSHDGRSLAVVRAGLFAPQNVFVVDVSSGRERQVTRFTRPSEGVYQHQWLPQDRHLVVSFRSEATSPGGNNDLGILDLQTGTLARATTTITESFDAPSLSSDGSRLVATVTSTRREVWKVPLTSGAPDVNGRAGVLLVDASHQPFWSFTSRDARTLLYNGTAGGGRNLWIRSLDGTATPRQITNIPGSAVTHASLSPDGRQVAFISSAGGTSDVWVQNVDGSDLRRLTNDAASNFWPVWSPDGQRVVYTSGPVTGPETWVAAADGSGGEKLMDGFFRGDWMKDPNGPGTLMVTSSRVNNRQGAVRRLDPENRTVIWETTVYATGFSVPMFSPDGRRISVPFQEGRNTSAIHVLDTASGHAQVVARLPFTVQFRADWADDGRALIVNRIDTTSHIVLFNRLSDWQ
jgi:Tol biopolymer transport system component